MSKLSWRAPEYVYTEKSADWYWIVGVVSVSFALIAIILNNVIFGILILVSTITLTLYASRPPREIEIELSQTGVKIGAGRDGFHPYETLESFWIELDTPHPKLIIKQKQKISMYLTVLLEEMSPEEIEDYLDDHLPKVEHHEPFLEKLLTHLGF